MVEVLERTEMLIPGPAVALGALLGVPVPDLETGEGLPLTWHWLYLLERPAQADLGHDGHPLRGTVPEPPGPGRRRMWAGGQIRALGRLYCGAPATRRSRVLAAVEKQGRTGQLTFVTVGHEIEQHGQVVLEERQDIVYRDARSGVAADHKPADAAALASDEWDIEISPSLLFRYSALTYNAHRIHYDREYARSVEGYPGLVTHGPLQATVMAEAARARGWHTGAGLTFDYRLVSPLFEHQGMIARGVPECAGLRMSVRARTGRQTATGLVSSR